MTTEYQLWYRDPREVIRNLLANPDLADGLDYVPYHEFENGKRRYCDFMSGDWVWEQCVRTLLVTLAATDPPSTGPYLS